MDNQPAFDYHTLVEAELAARILGVDPRTLANWRCLRRGPPYVKIGSLVRYQMSDIENFIAKHRVKTTDAS